jgi:hypothetical protein
LVATAIGELLGIVLGSLLATAVGVGVNFAPVGATAPHAGAISAIKASARIQQAVFMSLQR